MCLSSACRLIQKTLLLPLGLKLPGNHAKTETSWAAVRPAQDRFLSFEYVSRVRNLLTEGSSSSPPRPDIKILLRSYGQFVRRSLIRPNRRHHVRKLLLPFAEI
jgi:hypothetical protein